MKLDIKSMFIPELEEYFKLEGEQQFRAKQVFSRLHAGVVSFSDMTNLSLELRSRLDREFYISVPELIEKQVSETDGTAKFLWRLNDGESVECVLMQYKHGNTVCISSQVGCKMGCVFCASAPDGFKRNLDASEMLDQVIFTQNQMTSDQQDKGKRISNIVLMGIGEPLDNFDNVMRFIQLVIHPSGLNIGSRHITLSTCGMAENIDRLAQYDVQLTLAISLHAPDDDTRSLLIPANKRYGINELLEAGERYFHKTGRRVTYEYALIDGINDSPDQAELLSRLLDNTKSHLNLLLLNSIKECKYKTAAKENVHKFTNVLKKNGVNFTIRRSLGADIEASCGQLRHRHIGSNFAAGEFRNAPR